MKTLYDKIQESILGNGVDDGILDVIAKNFGEYWKAGLDHSKKRTEKSHIEFWDALKGLCQDAAKYTDDKSIKDGTYVRFKEEAQLPDREDLGECKKVIEIGRAQAEPFAVGWDDGELRSGKAQRFHFAKPPKPNELKKWTCFTFPCELYNKVFNATW